MHVAIVEENRELLSRFCQLIKAGDLNTVLRQLRSAEDQERFAQEGLAWMAKNAPAPAAPVVAPAGPVVAPEAPAAAPAALSELDQVRAELADVRAELADVRGRLHIASNRADALQRQVDDQSSRQELQSIRLSTLVQDLETLRGQLQQPTQAGAPTEQPPAAPTEQPSAAPTEQPAPVTVVFGGDGKPPKRSAKDV